MKVAICFYGLHPDECWKDRRPKSDKCFDYWTKNVLDNNNCDVFMHSFSSKTQDLLKYKPKSYLFEDVDYFNNNIVDREQRDYYFNKHNKKEHIPIILYIAYGIKKSVELMLEYSNEKNIKYDLILISRIDVCWLTPLNFDELNTEKFYSAIWGKKNYHSKRCDGFLAYWFLTNQSWIINFINIYDYIFKYFESDYSWHKITKLHVNSFLKEDSIEYKFNDIDNTPIDMDLQRYLDSNYNII